MPVQTVQKSVKSLKIEDFKNSKTKTLKTKTSKAKSSKAKTSKAKTLKTKTSGGGGGHGKNARMTLILDGDPTHQHISMGVGVNTPGSTRYGRIALVRVRGYRVSPLVAFVSVELHSLGLDSGPLPLGLGSGLATVHINAAKNFIQKHPPPGQPSGHDLKGAKPLFPGDNHCVQKPSPRAKTGRQKRHFQDIQLENFTNVSINSDRHYLK